jgi:3-hydroxy-9,10-secoandrosta-1,3,5(10)-triene-9,17-dione monooxygenase reductase component
MPPHAEVSMPDETEFDSRRFRDVVGHFATGVTVITLNLDGDLRGMTANAVSSLSLDPPLLLVCVQKTASIYEHFDRVEAFAMNVLSVEQEDISNLFASHGGPDEPLGGLSYHEGPLGSPILDGVIASADCKITQRYDGGDHTIVIGEAVSVSLDGSDAAPLLFYQGGYRHLTSS